MLKGGVSPRCNGCQRRSDSPEPEVTALDSSPKSSRNLPTAAGLLTPKEFAKIYKVSLSWLAKARKLGDGPPHVQFGRSVRYFPMEKPD